MPCAHTNTGSGSHIRKCHHSFLCCVCPIYKIPVFAPHSNRVFPSLFVYMYVCMYDITYVRIMQRMSLYIAIYIYIYVCIHMDSLVDIYILCSWIGCPVLEHPTMFSTKFYPAVHPNSKNARSE